MQIAVYSTVLLVVKLSLKRFHSIKFAPKWCFVSLKRPLLASIQYNLSALLNVKNESWTEKQKKTLYFQNKNLK